MKVRSLPLLLVLVVCSSLVIAQAPPLSTDEILKAAYKEAGRDKKNVFILFHASWCGWCHRMDTSMNDSKVKKFFTDNYVICHIVVYESNSKKALENPGGEDLLKKYYGNDQGIPYWLIFDKNGELLADSKVRKEGQKLEAGDNAGCPASQKEVDHFIEVLKKTSPLRPDQLQIIAKRFRENER
jgi:thiol-disulfide isomerase/thioredoxin